jgi:hypothetical protein
MARLKGLLSYRGSFKSVRHYHNLHNPATYAGEKGGANRDLIMNNPSFVRTRENMNEFGGVAVAVKSIRNGLQFLQPGQTDQYFTGRLIQLVKEINLRDEMDPRGQRSILFSAQKQLIGKMIFNVKKKTLEMLQGHFTCSHSVARDAATLSVTDLAIGQPWLPCGATHYRVLNHLCVISDYVYVVENRRYESLSALGGLGASCYSDFNPVNSMLSFDVVSSFPSGTVLTDDCTVMQCIGVEFYVRSFGDVYLPLKGGCLKVGEVF